MDRQLVPTGRVQDIFGVDYQLVLMPPNGLCGFSCFAYCITGDMCAYSDIIDDCFAVFRQNPQLFTLQTEFGRKQANLSHYSNCMRHAVANISAHSVPSILWLEDAHLIGYAMVYDIAVFVYQGDTNRWVVFNETGSRGYICLFFTGSHFDVMRGVDGGRPPVPPSAEHHDCMFWHPVQLDKMYSFLGVWTRPVDESVNVFQDSPSPAQSRLYTYADVLKSCSRETTHTADKQHAPARPTCTQQKAQKTQMIDNSRAEHEEEESGLCVHKCTLCCRVFNSSRGLRTHCTKVHRTKSADETTAQSSSEGSVSCSVCGNVFTSLQGLRLHQFRSHEVSSMDDVRRLETHTQDTATVNTGLNLGQSEHGDGECSGKRTAVRTTSFQCCVCKKQFASSRSLLLHQRRKHKAVHVGNVKTDAATVNVTAHETVTINTGLNSVQTEDGGGEHTGKTTAARTNKFQCDVCKTQFTNSSSLLAHQLRCMHKVICSVCNKEFKTQRNLHWHRAKFHSNTPKHSSTNEQESLHTEQTFNTDEVSHAQNQKQNKGGDEHTGKTTAARTNKFQCDVCKVQFTNLSSLLGHQLRCIQKFICSVCNKEFKTQRNLHAHCAKIHSKTPKHSSTNEQESSHTEQTFNTNEVSQAQNHKQNINHHSHSSGTLLVDECCSSRQVLNKQLSTKMGDLYKRYPPLDCSQTVETNDMHVKLKNYHDQLLSSVSNVSTQKVSLEVQEVVADVKLIDNVKRKFLWSKNDEERLNSLNIACKTLPVPRSWFWAADEESQQGVFNQKRMEFCMENELVANVVHCTQCKSTGVLVGLSQVNSTVCIDCLEQNVHLRRSHISKVKFNNAWDRVRPISEHYPKRVENGHESEELPVLTVGERAVIAAVHPVVTITKNFIANKKYRQESISLLHDSEKTWAKILPRNDLQHRFIVVERTFKDSQKKYIIANVARVRAWLNYLFKNHSEYMRMNARNELELSCEALSALERQSELAEVVHDDGTEDGQVDEEEGVVQSAMESGLSKSEIYTFDKYPNLYLKNKQMLRIKEKGLIEVVEDDSVRRPTYNASANLCFPHLYPNGEMSPLDFGDYKLARELLKKQTLFAHKMVDGSYKWHYAEDGIHLMHQFARLTEQRVHAMVGYYISQHPEKVHTPLQSVLNAFKDGMNEDGLLDSQLPELTAVMSRIPNSRQKWFAERLGIETISRDLGDPNLFITLNMDPRAWPDVRKLIYKLEYGADSEMDRNWYELNTETFTALLDKYAPQICIYLCRKAKIFLRAFFCGICRIPPSEVGNDKVRDGDWLATDRFKNGWYWSRVEFTETRGVQHWHCLAKLPNVLDTALLGRIIHNGRVVRQELKCGNIRLEKVEDAWNMIEMGLLASRYATLFADSISQASFYAEDIDVDRHDPGLVIDLDKLRKQFVDNYKQKNVSVDTHPIMRSFNDPECDRNQNVENAKVASVSCMHHCIKNICGGEENGVGCRFCFPKKLMPCTVPAVMQVNADQMEAHMLLKRSHGRVPNLNKYFLKYWRANHDVSVLIDAAHTMRYATKYASKSRKQNELLEGVIDHLSKRSNDLLPPNTKQALSHLILADCSHREFLSKPELAYKVMDLPEIQKNFNDVPVVGFYPRANLIESSSEDGVIVYSDRTEYSAYAERCRSDTVCIRFDKQELESMCFRDFVETVNYTWKLKRPLTVEPISPTSTRKFKTRDINSGFWELRKSDVRRHVRWSTVLYCEPAHMYEEVEMGKTTSQTLYFDLPINKRRQLYRAYQELVCYRPWKNSPDETFLSASVCKQLNESDPELENRYSLMKLEAYQRVYKDLWLTGEVAPEGSQWHRDNQYSYTMYLTSLHNSDIRLDRSANKGVFTARYEAADELEDVAVELCPPMNDDVDEADVPSVQNFLPPDALRGVLEQEPPAKSKICVAFPLQHAWQEREEMVKSSKVTLFMAVPPLPAIRRENMSFWHNRVIDLLVNGEQQIVYVYGKAGTGKTEVALHICKEFKGHVQAGAGTGKAASNFNGPTVHAMFGWSHNEYSQAVIRANEQSKLERLRSFYRDTDIFVIDEVNAMSAAELGLLDETMRKIFDPEEKLKDGIGTVKPFGGKVMVFLGDSAQLRPVCGAAIYDNGIGGQLGKSSRKSFQSTQYKQRTARGQTLYNDYLSKNCIWLERGFRNTGLLQEILDRVRNGQQTSDDLDKLLYQQRRYPAVRPNYGIHYSNESCSISNWLDLWSMCKQQEPPQRLYVSKAGYHTTGENDLIVSGLAAIPASQYNFAPDVLCVAIGCEVRLVYNLNVEAGLVNSATGTVVQVIYNNADVQALLDGEHPPAYCIVVNFPQFRGFLLGEERKFPFENPHWVPLYRQKFSPSRSLPSWIRKKQSPSQCYREQFPIDLSRHITAHRGQGQTWKNQLVSVSLGLESPNNHVPPDIGSVIYVACTRTNALRNLFVSPVFPDIWEKIGKSEQDVARRESEAKLRTDAGYFAELHGWHQEFLEEQSFVPDYSGNQNEWKQILNASGPPAYNDSCVPPDATDTLASHSRCDDILFSDLPSCGWLRPSERERHIGIDQGVNNFAMVAVDKTPDTVPVVVGAELYDLEKEGLNVKRFDVTDLVVLLQMKTVLMSWMQHPDYPAVLPQVDRVIVHIEQMSIKNKHSKQFSIDLGRLLQRLVHVDSCVVKLSQPHIHRATGPMFKLGDGIVRACKLTPATYESNRRVSRKRLAGCRGSQPDVKSLRRQKAAVPSDVEPDSSSDTDATVEHEDGSERACKLIPATHESNRRVSRKRLAGCQGLQQDVKSVRRQKATVPSDVEPDSSSDTDATVEHEDGSERNEYNRKKKMSKNIFQYFMHAGLAEQVDMQVNVSQALQVRWKDAKVKFDDLGDALLHALNELLCGTSNYRPLVPSTPSLHVNRTVVITVLSDKVYWIVLQCTWNLFTLENIGLYKSHLPENPKYASRNTVEIITSNLDRSLRQALVELTASELYTGVEHIKIVVKQIQRCSQRRLTSKGAGALTSSTVEAMKMICDAAAGDDSRLSVRNTKQEGWTYIRTLPSGKKLQVVRSTGKHTNALLAFLEWAKQHTPGFVKDRPLRMDYTGKLKFFHALKDLCSLDSNSYQMEMLRITNHVAQLLRSGLFSTGSTHLLADLILIGLNKNSQYVSALAPTYRRDSSRPKTSK